ncbi:hypothetical protein [Cellulophaga baltica]|uniref:hypothetical protein n=1 Tax=Cellulophaga baltica TaxID=76594 RepID=UPI002494159F|nr:hypothetical protein [Cellulophaga baltica]
MKNLENYGVQELKVNEVKSIDGGKPFGFSSWASFWIHVSAAILHDSQGPYLDEL